MISHVAKVWMRNIKKKKSERLQKLQSLCWVEESRYLEGDFIATIITINRHGFVSKSLFYTTLLFSCICQYLHQVYKQEHQDIKCFTRRSYNPNYKTNAGNIFSVVINDDSLAAF